VINRPACGDRLTISRDGEDLTFAVDEVEMESPSVHVLQMVLSERKSLIAPGEQRDRTHGRRLPTR